MAGEDENQTDTETLINADKEGGDREIESSAEENTEE